MRERYSSKKKLGVLVSSLALVAVTAMAGVTGTAAWFTASRVKTVTASEFTAYDSNSTLEITASNEAGTTVSSSTAATVTPTTTNGFSDVLTDASYDVANKILVSDIVADEGNEPAGYEAVVDRTTTHTGVLSEIDGDSSKYLGNYNSNKVTSTGAKIFYAMTWTYKVTYTFSNATDKVALFLYPNGSTLSEKDAKSTFNGFRLSLDSRSETEADNSTANHVVAATKPVIYYPSGDDDSMQYVKATFSPAADKIPAKYSFTAQSIHGTDDGVNMVGLGSSTNTSNGKYADGHFGTSSATGVTAIADADNYFGTFTPATGVKSASIYIHCTAWYEGSCNKVVSGANTTFSSVSASLQFYVRNLAN